MVKSVIKEILIMLLLCIAIVLIFGLLFYDYIPTNKMIPAKEAYVTPNEVKEENGNAVESFKSFLHGKLLEEIKNEKFDIRKDIE